MNHIVGISAEHSKQADQEIRDARDAVAGETLVRTQKSGPEI